MEEQHITIETALVAKQKGFTVAEIDFHSSTFYALFRPLYSADALGLASKFTYTDWLCGYDGDYEGPLYKDVIAFAPSQSFLQKWLRDIHNIYIFVNFYTSSPKRNVGFGFHIIRDHDGRIQNEFNHNDDLYRKYYGGVGLGKGIQFKTYEESLEAGLQECLNLIK